MPSNEIQPTHDADEPRPIRMLCMGCKRWIGVSSDGPKYLFMDGLGAFPPPDKEAIEARAASGGFMHRHMTRCKRAIAAIHESDPRWATLDEANREYETDAA